MAWYSLSAALPLPINAITEPVRKERAVGRYWLRATAVASPARPAAARRGLRSFTCALDLSSLYRLASFSTVFSSPATSNMSPGLNS